MKVEEREEIRQEYIQLEEWFTAYDTEVIKSIRRKSDISELHEQAEKNAKRVIELREKLKDNKNADI